MGFQENFHDRVTPLGDRAFGHAVVLIQAEKRSVSFTAVWEDRDYDIEEVEGFYTKYHARDFQFDMAAPVTEDGETLTPREGDRIEITEAGRTRQLEILPVGDLPAVEEMDGAYRWRVHTKRTK